MSFYVSLSGLKGAQSDLSIISNNIANADAAGFKRSRAQFGDLFTPATRVTIGNGTRLNNVVQQFSQGALEATDRTLDLAIAGEGFFVTRGAPPGEAYSFTRHGAFQVAADRRVVDTIGSTLQLLPVDAAGNVTSSAIADAIDFVLPAGKPADPTITLANVSINTDGLVTATYVDGTDQKIGRVALASFSSSEGLRQIGDSHWQSTGDSGLPKLDGAVGTIRSGTIERSNVDITEELVSLISAQRNFQANAKAIETASNMTQTIMNMN